MPNNPENQEKTKPIKAKFNLICASKCKKLALSYAQSNPSPTRAAKFTRVGEDFLIACEAELRRFIQARVDSHPSKGKTLM